MRRVLSILAHARSPVTVTVVASVSALLTIEYRYQQQYQQRYPLPRVPNGPGLIEEARPVGAFHEARRIGLNVTGAGYSLRRVLRADDRSRQFIYENGRTALSIFVAGRGIEALDPDPQWRTLPLRPGEVAYAYEDVSGQPAIAWLHRGRRCIATAGVSVDDLLEAVRALSEPRRNAGSS